MKQLTFAIIGSLAFLVSCNKEDSVSAAGDVYIASQLSESGQDTLYGLSIHAYSFEPFSTVTVNTSGATYNLAAYPGFKTDFYYDTPKNELTTEKPAAGNYHFRAVFESGEILETEDNLYSDVLFPPKFKECKFDVANSKAIIEWEAVANADLYVIRFYDDDELVFLSSAIDPAYKKMELNANGYGWGEDYTPETGTNFKVMLIAYKYETGGDDFNVQASTSNTTTLTWGQ